MAYTQTYYNRKVHVLAEDAVWGLVRWLVNDTTSVSSTASAQDASSSAGPAGPGWRIVACRSNTALFQTQATGSITTVAGSSLIDGETVTISDAMTTMVFEFDSNGVWTVGNVRVPFTAGDTADQVRDAVITAINQFTGTLFSIEASSGGSGLVNLINRVASGTSANNTITDTVAAGGFTTTGMSGGVQSSGAGTLSGIVSTGDGVPTNWRDGSLVDSDWVVLQSNRVAALGMSVQATGILTPDTTAAPATSTATVTINGTTLTGINGTRSSGSDDFDRGVTPVAALAAEIAAALNDAANTFLTAGIIREARVLGSTVEVEADIGNHYGLLGNLMGFSTTSSGTVGTGYAVDNASLTGGKTTEEFEVYLNPNATTIQTLLIPLTTYLGGAAAFQTSTADAAPPAFPALSVGDTIQNPVDVVILEPGTWVGVADEGMFAFICDGASLTNASFEYIGDVEGSLPGDEAPFVIRGKSVEIHHDFSSSQDVYGRVSPADDSTVLADSLGTGGWATDPIQHTTKYVAGDDTYMPNTRLGKWVVVPVGVYYPTAAHRHFAGWLRNCWATHMNIGVRGTLASKAYLYRTDAVRSTVDHPLVLKWDGITTY